MTSNLNGVVQDFWEKEACGTGRVITGGLQPHTREWFEQVEEHRYRVEPFIHSIAQFTRYHGKHVLEIGVGAGTDHLQWARAGAVCHGVDLTERAIEVTSRRLALYGFESQLQRIDAESLPFEDGRFDVVYSWGVIHHSEDPDRIVGEIRRVLKPGGVFVGMLYGRRSVLAAKLWLRHALAKGKPIRSLKDVVWHHMESLGTKAYTERELNEMFGAFSGVEVIPLLTSYDTSRLPRAISAVLPQSLGWFLAVRAIR